jgi:hypothetical protein
VAWGVITTITVGRIVAMRYAGRSTGSAVRTGVIGHSTGTKPRSRIWKLAPPPGLARACAEPP